MSSPKWRGVRTWGSEGTRLQQHRYTLLERRRVVSATGVARWEYRGRYLDGVASEWVLEAESLDSFTPLRLDTFHALWNLYDPSSERSRPVARDDGARRRPALSRKEALRRFPIGTRSSTRSRAERGSRGGPGRFTTFIRRTGASASPTTIGKS